MSTATKPWREVAQPHQDVLQGSFKQSEFAADITQVHGGTAPPEYQDAEQFYARTFITEGMRLLLTSVAQRLATGGGDPVIQLQTAFGGGKTHTLLAVYHLASRTCPVDRLAGVPTILDEAGINGLPEARVAVIDGIRLSPSQSRSHGDTTIHTLWGELAWQLNGSEGYRHVANADRDGTSPGKEALTSLIRSAAPCVILVDELVAYIRQFEPGKQYIGGSYDSNISFIQALTEAMKSVPNAILLASLPESELEVGGAVGRQALAALEKYFGRLESMWKPVAAEEAFEIVRRRLFDSIGNESDVQATARAFGELYRGHPHKFPTDVQEARYEERIARSYPIHPEIFDRLYEDWSTLDKFQRTRGVLQYLAIVIHRLWNDGDKDALIQPGSLPLGDANVRNKSVHYLPTGWEQVIEAEIDGPRAEATEIDGHETRFGSIQAARRVARTIFLGSAPSHAAQTSRGIRVERILLGSAQPGQAVGTYEDVIKRLRDRLHYLYGERDSYWFDTRPNLRREMESRKRNVSETDDVRPLLRRQVSRVFGRNHFFDGIHVFTPSADVPDDYGHGPRLVVLPPSAGYRKQDESSAFQAAQQILEKRGDAPRLKQNRLLFLLPDADTVPRLRDAARTYLAWASIVEDVGNERIDLGTFEARQAQQSRDAADEHLRQMVRETWRWLLAPGQEMKRGRMESRWEVVGVSAAAPNLVEAIQSKLTEEEWVITTWSPIHLNRLLEQWYFSDDVTHVSALKIWQDTCHYLYLPRLANSDVFKQAVIEGANGRDYFACADEATEDGYHGFHFGRAGIVALDEDCVLISHAAAEARQRMLDVRAHDDDSASFNQPEQPEPGGNGGSRPADSPDTPQPSPGEDSGQPTRFYGTTELDPVTASMDFSTIVEEIVQHFTTQLDVDVSINVEISARSRDGFDQGLQRTINENCGVLRFKTQEFD
ncbi:DUF499 domain-containing protein [Salinisphaera sp.]|uniref:ATP-binding protein n=1 Tax=Salinisphaera sp. TaxID=1914330 RepID=UPI000C44B8FF|nr:DUF499 domain-containing protein [Salinisphaera sp.]MAS10374.1 hypothetical protein [Salinisphaera sp.]|tara:strand:- start:376 stop:3204 length:2829 start_codon:yes stop_codon:yes gene_type:complete